MAQMRAQRGSRDAHDARWHAPCVFTERWKKRVRVRVFATEIERVRERVPTECVL